MTKHVHDDAAIKAVADAIRNKTGKTAQMTVSQMPAEIGSITGGGGGDAVHELVSKTITSYSNPNITEVYDYTFYGCSALTSVSLPAVTKIGAYAFRSCSALKYPVLDWARMNTISNYALGGTSPSKRGPTYGDVIMPEINFIGTGAFSYSQIEGNFKVQNLTKLSGDPLTYVKFSDGSEVDMSGLTTLTTVIGNNSSGKIIGRFGAAEKLSSSFAGTPYDVIYFGMIEIGATLGGSLRHLVIRGDTLSTIKASSYLPTNFKTLGYLYVPRTLVDTYAAATNWSVMAGRIRAIEDYTKDGTITGDLDPSKI